MFKVERGQSKAESSEVESEAQQSCSEVEQSESRIINHNSFGRNSDAINIFAKDHVKRESEIPKPWFSNFGTRIKTIFPSR
jgi:hypothetical protein